MLRNGRLTNPIWLPLAAAALLLGSACGDSNDATPAPASTADTPSQQPTRTAATATPASDRDHETTTAYLQQVETLLNALAEATTAVADIMAEADPDSAAWREAATTALSVFQTLHQQAERFEVGPDVDHVQDRLLVATEAYFHAAALIRDSIESLDLDALDEANIALGEALLAAAEVRLLIDELASS